MWFWWKRAPERDALRDLRDALIHGDRQALPLAPLMDSKQFIATIEPEVERRWEAHCFCTNLQFLKLTSFDFRDYGIAPASLLDTEFLVSRIIIGKFAPLGPWTQGPDGGSRRFGCPQCSRQFEVRAEEYSISMSVLSAKPIAPAPRADYGRYAGSYHIFAGREHELAKITDYRPADSVAQYLDELTTPG